MIGCATPTKRNLSQNIPTPLVFVAALFTVAESGPQPMGPPTGDG